MTAPWPIVAVESRGGNVVRVTHVDSTIADHVFSYLIGRPGVFAALTAETIRTAQVRYGTVAWETEAGVVDVAPDALYEHAYGRCPGSTCRGWTPAHTVLVRPADS